MVESAFEFADICRKHDYHNFVFSMKASNPLVMVAAYRLLAEEQYKRGWDYPLHLGVTEAGEGEDGRMKSAIGIGALLMDGLGDTIRVSLTEDPELEMDPCRRLAQLGTTAATQNVGVSAFEETTRDTHVFTRREGDLPAQREGDSLDYRTILHPSGSVFSALSLDELDANAELTYRKLGCKLAVGIPLKDIATSDSVFLRELPPSGDAETRRALRRLQESGVHVVAPVEAALADPLPGVIPVFPLSALADGATPSLPEGSERFAVRLDGTESDALLASALAPGQSPQRTPVCALLDPEDQPSRLHASRRVFETLQRAGSKTPVIHHVRYPSGADKDEIVIATGSRVGGLLVDGLGDGVMIEAQGADLDFLRTTSFGLLQGCRMRNIKTEFVSCPSCGRTLFDLQEVTEEIRQKTGHLPFVTIAVMGCIVNGPGEMADADVGYVGGAPGKIDLYVGKEVVKRGIPMEGASDALVQLIKDIGKWVDKDEDDSDGGSAAPAKELAGAASA
jgi:(E)-4-hydroxy-3-methylbut-2-enyl-diphosphate synthase